MKILIAGDFCQRYRVDEEICQRNYSGLFDNVIPIINQFEYTIINFEFPIVTSKGNPIPKCGPNLKGTHLAIEAIKYAGFNTCTLANNHILDQGDSCCLDTILHLENAGMKTVGAGKNLIDAEKILYLRENTQTLAIINCCEHEFSIATDTTAGANPLSPVRQYYAIQEAKKKADHVLVIVHGGHEYFQLPSLRMQEAYRFFIDAGADVVINHHQHCYSGYEVYKSKPIFYGLGNFCFDHITERNSSWNEGYMVGLNLDKSEKIQYELIPYAQCRYKVAVELLSTEERCAFDKRLSDLNKIISDENRLKAEIQNYYDSCAEFELRLLEPYDNLFLSKLYRLGILPKIFRGQKNIPLRIIYVANPI